MLLLVLLGQPLLVLGVCSSSLYWIKLRDFSGTRVEGTLSVIEMRLIDSVVALAAEAADDGGSAHSALAHSRSLPILLRGNVGCVKYICLK